LILVIYVSLHSVFQTSPRFVQKIGCEFVFSWDVPEVCVEASVKQDTCTYLDPVTKATMNFTQLQQPTTFEVSISFVSDSAIFIGKHLALSHKSHWKFTL